MHAFGKITLESCCFFLKSNHYALCLVILNLEIILYLKILKYFQFQS